MSLVIFAFGSINLLYRYESFWLAPWCLSVLLRLDVVMAGTLFGVPVFSYVVKTKATTNGAPFLFLRTVPCENDGVRAFASWLGKKQSSSTFVKVGSEGIRFVCFCCMLRGDVTWLNKYKHVFFVRVD